MTLTNTQVETLDRARAVIKDAAEEILSLRATQDELVEALTLATQELNAIRARDGCPISYQMGLQGPIRIELCTHEWWNELTEQCYAALAKAKG